MITDQVKEIVTRSEIQNGFCLVFSRHTTCSVMIDEDSIDKAYTGLTHLQQDLTDVFEDMIPTCRKEGQYMHPGPEATVFAAAHGEDKPGTLNTDAHLRSSIMGRSETVPVVDGKLDLGEFGHIYFVDFDHNPCQGAAGIGAGHRRVNSRSAGLSDWIIFQSLFF